MNENKSCTCPFCNNTIPADTTANEHLTTIILSIYKEIQAKAEYEDCTDNPIPCPRCGHTRMSPKITRNALSRHADIQICDTCGTDEAICIATDIVMPLSSWWITKAVSAATADEPKQENQPAQEIKPNQTTKPRRDNRPKQTGEPKQANKRKRISKSKSNTKGQPLE